MPGNDHTARPVRDGQPPTDFAGLVCYSTGLRTTFFSGPARVRRDLVIPSSTARRGHAASTGPGMTAVRTPVEPALLAARGGLRLPLCLRRERSRQFLQPISWPVDVQRVPFDTEGFGEGLTPRAGPHTCPSTPPSIKRFPPPTPTSNSSAKSIRVYARTQRRWLWSSLTKLSECRPH